MSTKASRSVYALFLVAVSIHPDGNRLTKPVNPILPIATDPVRIS
jgi:hypothetical protein